MSFFKKYVLCMSQKVSSEEDLVKIDQEPEQKVEGVQSDSTQLSLEEIPSEDILPDEDLTDPNIRSLKEHANCFSMERIANGAYGTVYACSAREPSAHNIPIGMERVACKMYLFGNGVNHIRLSMLIKGFQQDLKAINYCHENIMKVFSCYQVLENICSKKLQVFTNCSPSVDRTKFNILNAGVFMEKLDINVQDLAKTFLPGPLPESERKLIFKQIGSALHYIHSEHHVCHLDIKSNNIGVVLGSNGNQFKLIDFGNSAKFSQATYDLYRQGKIKYNPFQTDVFYLTRTVIALAIPNTEHKVDIKVLLQKHLEVLYEDDNFKMILTRLALAETGCGMSLDRALMRIQ